MLDVERVVRADLGAEAVLQRRDDAAAVRVVLGVRRRDEHDVEREPDLVAPDLDVALLEHVQQADLDALGEVGQLVDREDAAVRARHEPVVDRELVGEVAALGDLDRVDLADEVGDRRVGRRQLLAEAPVAVHPLDRRLVAALGDEQTRRAARPGAYGSSLISLPATIGIHSSSRLGERADDAGLRLAPLAEEDHVVAGEQRVLELREDGVLVADDARRRAARPRRCGRWRSPRTSSLTGRETQPLARSSPRVAGSGHGCTVPLSARSDPNGAVRLAALRGPYHALPSSAVDLARHVAGARVADGDLAPALRRPRLRRRRLGRGRRVPGHWRSTPAFAASRRPAAVPAPLRRAAARPGPARLPRARRRLLLRRRLARRRLPRRDRGLLRPAHASRSTDALRAADGEHVARGRGRLPAARRPHRQAHRSPASSPTGTTSTPTWNPGGIWRPVRLRDDRPGPHRPAALPVRRGDRGAGPAAARPDARRRRRPPTRVTARLAARRRPARARRRGPRRAHAATSRSPRATTTCRWTRRRRPPAAVVAVASRRPAAAATSRSSSRSTASPATGAAVRTAFREVRMRRLAAAASTASRLFVDGLEPGADADGSSAEATAAETARATSTSRVDANLDLLRVHAHVTRPELYDAADEAGPPAVAGLPAAVGLRAGACASRRCARPGPWSTCSATTRASCCGARTTSRSPSTCSRASPSPRRQMARLAASMLLPDVEQGRARPLGRRGPCTRPTRPARSTRTRACSRASGAAAPTPTSTSAGTTATMDGLAPRAARGAAARPASSPSSAPRPCPRPADFMEPERWPDLDWDRLFERHALPEAVLRPLRAARRLRHVRRRGAPRPRRTRPRVIQLQVEDLRRLKYAPDRRLLPLLLRRRAPGGDLVGARPRPRAARPATPPSATPAAPSCRCSSPGPGSVHVVSELRTGVPDVVVDVSARRPDASGDGRGDVAARRASATSAGSTPPPSMRASTAATRSSSPCSGQGEIRLTEPLRPPVMLESVRRANGGLAFRVVARSRRRGLARRTSAADGRRRRPARHGHRRADPASHAAGRPPFLVALLPLRGRQEVGHGDHRHRRAGLRARPHGREPQDLPRRRAASTTTASGCATLGDPPFPRTFVLWVLRIGAHRARSCSTSPRRTQLTRMNQKARPVKYQSQRDYVAANFAVRTMRWTGVIVAPVRHLPPARPDAGARPTPTSCAATCTTTWSRASSEWPVAIVYIVANARARLPHLSTAPGACSRASGSNNPRLQPVAPATFAVGLRRGRSPSATSACPIARRHGGGRMSVEHRRSSTPRSPRARSTTSGTTTSST